MKKNILLFFAAAFIVFTVGCSNNNARITPGQAVSEFFGYLTSGDVRAADAVLLNSNGGFAEMAEGLHDMLGVFIFRNIAYNNLEYTINGNNATATFEIDSVDFFLTSYLAGFELGAAMTEAGEEVDLNDPGFDEWVTMLVMEVVGNMINDELAPRFSADVSIDLRLMNNVWRIVDDDEDFLMLLLGMSS